MKNEGREEVTVMYFEQADEIYSDNLVYKAMLDVLVERGKIKMLCSNEPKRQQSMLHFLHGLLPSTYSEEVVLGLDGTDCSLLPELDEPFDFSRDPVHVVTDADIIEIYEFDYASYEVCSTRRPPPAIIPFLKKIRE